MGGEVGRTRRRTPGKGRYARLFRFKLAQDQSTLLRQFEKRREIAASGASASKRAVHNDALPRYTPSGLLDGATNRPVGKKGVKDAVSDQVELGLKGVDKLVDAPLNDLADLGVGEC